MPALRVTEVPGGFEVRLGDRLVLEHGPGRTLLAAGLGEDRFKMRRGNFEVTESLEELVALTDFELILRPDGGAEALFSRRGEYPVRAAFVPDNGRLSVSFRVEPRGATTPPNRFRVRLPAESGERVYGAGEQFSHLNLRGRVFPLWSSEQGVGRNPLTEVTRLANLHDGAGGDYWWTFYPQPTFCSSRRVYYHFESSAWASFDFRSPDRHEYYVWQVPLDFTVGAADSMLELVSDLTGLLGRQPELPDWAYDGVILGIQGGTGTCLVKLKRAQAEGVPVAGIWAQDWQGINMTSFGQRLRWNWVWDSTRYPGLDEVVRRLRVEGVRFLGYINPYLAAGRSLYEEAAGRGFLARRADGTVYLVDFGEFLAGIVDFTDPGAVEWYKGVIRRNLIGFGLSGWMADFGEYLPTDAILADGTPATLAHNLWPAVWARVNREAVDEAGASGDVLYFMRAGFTGSQKWCPLVWAGDQNVDWSPDDGLPSVIPAALSLAMSGHGLHHSDIGGYTTLYNMRRSRELFQRWAELAAFTPFMRSHEGNRPEDNWQFDSDVETLRHLASMVRLHVALKPYLKHCVRANALLGYPVQRPLFLHFEGDPSAWTIQDQFLLGPDLLAAPVLEENAVSRKVHLPPGQWTDFWTGRTVASPEPLGLDLDCEAPLGRPPAFFRLDSSWAEVFRKAAGAA
ncbi:MAG TPA: alpha-glucosidase, partial [Magnetospirillaceae bacterium]|nr:alpha-glucosidase [Magnetospirillaceae bacterium]